MSRFKRFLEITWPFLLLGGMCLLAATCGGGGSGGNARVIKWRP